jgi:uncharacterized protein (TIGR03437 family)
MRLLTLVTLAVPLWLGLAVPASAQTPRVGGLLNCNLATLSKGTSYGTAFSGFAGTTPVATYGVITADGNGGFSGFGTESIGGVISSVVTSGSYTMTPGCTGTSTIRDSAGLVTHYAFTINSNGGVIEFVETDSGTTTSGVAEPLAICDSAAFSGPYMYAVSGWVDVNGVYLPYADAGRMVADGKGNLNGKSTLSSAGKVQKRTLSGTYSIGTNCTGTASLTDNLGNSGVLAMTVIDNGQQVLAIDTTPGRVTSGRAYRGQFSCNNGSVSGSYLSSAAGFGVSPGVLTPAAYSGSLAISGGGSLQGADAISQGGVVRSRTFTANFSVNSDCSASEAVQDSLGETANVDFYITDQSGRVEFIQTDNGLVIAGQAQQVASGTCTNATVNGPYGYALEGWLSPLTGVADAGQDTADGVGHFTGATTTSFGGTIEPRTLSGTYQVNSDCSATSTFTDSLGNTAHFRNAVSPDGQRIYAIETDANTTITSISEYQFAPPSAAIVNAGSFANSVAPGSLISIFGDNLASGAVTASGIWPTQLGNTKVSVNGTALPLYYVSPTQVNAQLPVDLAAGSAQLTVSVGGTTSATVNFTVVAAAPGIFTYSGLLRAIAQDFTGNPNGTLVGPSTPAHAGDVLVVYLTGGGAVKPTGGTWTTGGLAPPGLSPVTAPYSVTIGGLPATTTYLGLTSGFIGLYQLNVQVPAGLPSGDHTLTITVNGKASSSALVTLQ